MLFEMEGVKLTFTDDALKCLAQNAIQRKSGARGLRAIMEDCLRDIMFELPSLVNVIECVIGEKVILNRSKPILIYQPSKISA